MTVSFCGKLQTNVGETTNRGSNAASDTVRRYQNTCWPLTLSWTKLQPVLFHYVCQKHLATFVSQWFVSQWFGQQTLSQQMVVAATASPAAFLGMYLMSGLAAAATAIYAPVDSALVGATDRGGQRGIFPGCKWVIVHPSKACKSHQITKTLDTSGQ